MISPHLRKPISADKLLPMPWDRQTEQKQTTSPEEARQRLKILMQREQAKQNSN